MIIDEGVDGEAVCAAFAAITGPDCLMTVLKKFGTGVKVYKFLKDVMESEVDYVCSLYSSYNYFYFNCSQLL